MKFKSFTDIPRNATAASNEGMFGEHKNSWPNLRKKNALQKTAKVPLWDGEPATLERWIHRTLRWRRNHANSFHQGQQAKILIAVIENEGVRDRIEKAYDRKNMSLKDLWFCITGRVMENIHRPEAVWRARHFPNVVLTSRKIGLTMRHTTAQLLAVLEQHTEDVPADKKVKAAYNKLYSLQAEYAGLEFNYLEMILMMLPLIQASAYQEQQEEYMDNPSDAFPWGAWPRDAAVDTHKQAGRQSTALTGASSCSCHVTKRFRILATLKQGNKSMYSNTSGYVHMGLRLVWGKGITEQ